MKLLSALIVIFILLAYQISYSQFKAVDDPLSTTMNTQSTHDILQNDIAVDGTVASLSNVKILLATKPNHGEAKYFARDTTIGMIRYKSGVLVYEPFAGFTGEDIIVYQICDIGNPGNCQVANINITVVAIPSTFMKLVTANVSVQRSIDDANIAGKPAEFAYFHPISGINPQGNKDYFQLNGTLGIKLPAFDTPSNLVSGKVSYNRNSGLEKPQNSLAVGLTEEHVFKSGIANGTLDYRKDYEKKTHSFQAIGLFTPAFLFFKNYKPNNYFFTGKLPADRLTSEVGTTEIQRFKLIYTMSVGLEFEKKYDIDPAKTNEQGFYFRPVGKIGIKISPPYLHKLLTISGNLDYRYDIARPETYILSKDHPLTELGIEYNLINDDKSTIGFGITYKNGDNPIENLQKNEYWSLALRVKIK